ncbi:MAG: accessory gene regulator AgrB [Bacilli bacterium]|nr:accessory gene regulator AgrB [Bacilli bacterium]
MGKEWFMTKVKHIVDKQYSHYSKKELNKIYYGLEGLYCTVPKLTTILLLSIVTGSSKEILILILSFNILRHVAFGAHAPKSYICFIISALIFVGVSLITPLLVISKIIRLLIGVVCITIFIFYAPADTKKRPLLNRDQRKQLKVLSILIGTVYILTSLIIKNNLIANTFLLALIIEAILILPITYILFKQTYRNYNNY